MTSETIPNRLSEFDTVSHRDIIRRAGGPARVGSALQPAVDANTVKAWARLDSIPGPYWDGFAEADLASLDELSKAASVKRRAAAPDNSLSSAA